MTQRDKFIKIISDIAGQRNINCELKDNKLVLSDKEVIFLTDEQYNNLYCFELFGKIEQLEKFNVNDTISVDFNVNCNEYQGKYYTTLQAWRLENKGSTIPDPPKGEKVEVEETNDLPF